MHLQHARLVGIQGGNQASHLVYQFSSFSLLYLVKVSTVQRETSSNAPSSADGPGQIWILGTFNYLEGLYTPVKHERALSE